jgi:ribosomal protein S18 acetylase RimI-like enzyme
VFAARRPIHPTFILYNACVAAVPEAHTLDLVDLWQIRVDELEAMLREEIATWRQQLDWDFRASADLVRRFVEVHALNGFALLAGETAVAYAYFVCEEHKGLLGDLFLCERFRTPENERRLMSAIVDQLIRTRGIRRIESQLMLARPGQRRALPAAVHGRAFERHFMTCALPRPALAERRMDRVVFDHWTERRQDEAAGLIAAAYRGHIDSEINDQYRSAEGARRFLFNIVQYPGCGTFFPPASWVAIDRTGGRICGASLTSMVAAEVGHVTQICTAPAVRGTGVGYELLRRSLESLAAAGARTVSLTVTGANETAIRLYRSAGFEIRKRFPAFVWEGF